MRNKILIAAISLLLLVALVVSVSAAGTVATTDGQSCAKGGMVTLTVSITSTSDVIAGAVEVFYDKDVLELAETRWYTDGALLSTFDKNTEKGAFAFQSGKNLSGRIFSVTFNVLDDAPLGKTDVECRIQLKTESNDISVTNNKGYVNVTCKHSFTEKSNEYLAGEASCTSPATYYYSCSLCGEKGRTTYTFGTALPHTFDKKLATTDYLVESVTCVDEAEYYYSCKCGAKGSTTFTADASWSHKYSSALYVSRDGHWYACSACGSIKDYSAHTPDDGVCTVCKFVLPTDGHIHDHSTVKYDSVGHWNECECGDKKDLAFHIFGEWVVNGDSQSQTCSACGYVNTISVPEVDEEHTHDYGSTLRYDSVGHWSECECGDKKGLAFHTFGEWVVNGDSQSQTCSACGYVNTISVPEVDEEHTHDFGSTLKFDSVGHWSECECGDKKDLAFHTYGDWVVNGESRSQTCTACGYVNTTSVPDIEDDGADTPPEDEKNNENLTPLFVGILSAIGGIALTILAVFVISYVRNNPKTKPEPKDAPEQNEAEKEDSNDQP